MLGELRLLVTLVLGLVFGVAGIWIFRGSLKLLSSASPERRG